MLVSQGLEGTIDKVAIAIERLRMFCPPEGYYLAFSGGKDSQVIYDLAQKAAVPFVAEYCLTTVDPPELVRFIRTEYPEVSIAHPAKSMWQLIEEYGMPPTRILRYCCRILKESHGVGVIVTGVRWAESVRRAKRKMLENCTAPKLRKFLHPIIDWSDAEVWEYHHLYLPKHCSLYDEGFRRIGCVLCPMVSSPIERAAHVRRWPKLAESYHRACRRAYARNVARGKEQRWSSGNALFAWFLSGGRHTVPKGQDALGLFDD